MQKTRLVPIVLLLALSFILSIGFSMPHAKARAATMNNAMGDAASGASGERLYEQNCEGCHGADGRGEAGVFPPLDGATQVTANPMRLNAIVLFGQRNVDVAVDGKLYNGQMPAWKDYLSNADIASIDSYIRAAWSNKATPTTVADVKSAVSLPELAAHEDHFAFAFQLNHIKAYRTASDHGADTVGARLLVRVGSGTPLTAYWDGCQLSAGHCNRTREVNDARDPKIVELCCTYVKALNLTADDSVTVQVTLVNQAKQPPEPEYDGVLQATYKNPKCYIGASFSETDSGSSGGPTSDCSSLTNLWLTIKDALGFLNCDALVLNYVSVLPVSQLLDRTRGASIALPAHIVDNDHDLGPAATSEPCGLTVYRISDRYLIEIRGLLTVYRISDRYLIEIRGL